MNEFEKKISDQYQKCISELVKDATITVAKFDIEEDPIAVRDHEVQVNATYRIVYLALKEYHRTLSTYLANSGISLPDFDELLCSK